MRSPKKLNLQKCCILIECSFYLIPWVLMIQESTIVLHFSLYFLADTLFGHCVQHGLTRSLKKSPTAFKFFHDLVWIFDKSSAPLRKFSKPAWVALPKRWRRLRHEMFTEENNNIPAFKTIKMYPKKCTKVNFIHITSWNSCLSSWNFQPLQLEKKITFCLLTDSFSTKWVLAVNTGR